MHMLFFKAVHSLLYLQKAWSVFFFFDLQPLTEIPTASKKKHSLESGSCLQIKFFDMIYMSTNHLREQDSRLKWKHLTRKRGKINTDAKMTEVQADTDLWEGVASCFIHGKHVGITKFVRASIHFRFTPTLSLTEPQSLPQSEVKTLKSTLHSKLTCIDKVCLRRAKTFWQVKNVFTIKLVRPGLFCQGFR